MFMRFRTIATVVASLAIGVGLSQTKSEQPLSGFRISGRFVDQSDAPIAGQVVSFRIVDSGSPDVVKTGEDGRFAFTFDGESPYELYATVKDSLDFKLITIVVANRDLDLGDVALQFPAQGGATGRVAGPVQIASSQLGVKTTTATSPRSTRPAIAALYISCSATSTEWCDHSVMHIITDDGREVVPPSEKDQVGCRAPQISEDRLEAGWLIESDNCCTSYPISTVLVVFRLGKPIRRFEAGMAIMGWGFLARGKQVAYHTDVLHGTSAPHDEVRDIETGRLVRQIGRRDHE